MQNKLTTEVLESILKGESVVDKEEFIIPRKERVEKVRPGILTFIKEYELQAGQTKVPNYVLFYVYRAMFTKVNNGDKLNNSSFFRQLSKFFKSYRTGKMRYYLLDNPFSVEVYEKAENYKRLYYTRKKNVQEK